MFKDVEILQIIVVEKKKERKKLYIRIYKDINELFFFFYRGYRINFLSINCGGFCRRKFFFMFVCNNLVVDKYVSNVYKIVVKI